MRHPENPFFISDLQDNRIPSGAKRLVGTADPTSEAIVVTLLLLWVRMAENLDQPASRQHMFKDATLSFERSPPGQDRSPRREPPQSVARAGQQTPLAHRP